MSACGAALRLAWQRGWPVFPCQWSGPDRRKPLVKNGFYAASRAPRTIIAWWSHWPNALIGVPTGRATGFVVLDIDRKNGIDGFDALDDLSHSILPDTWIAHTPSGGLHVYFDPGGREIRNSAGKLGPGLDVRGDGGYVIVPSPGSGYTWDPHLNPDSTAPAPMPAWLLPREPVRAAPTGEPVKPTIGLSPYADAALISACRRILAGPAGEQEATINSEAFAIGTLAGAGAIPADFARRSLIWAARQVPSHDAGRPWREHELRDKVERAFKHGMTRPREARRHA